MSEERKIAGEEEPAGVVEGRARLVQLVGGYDGGRPLSGEGAANQTTDLL